VRATCWLKFELGFDDAPVGDRQQRPEVYESVL